MKIWLTTILAASFFALGGCADRGTDTAGQTDDSQMGDTVPGGAGDTMTTPQQQPDDTMGTTPGEPGALPGDTSSTPGAGTDTGEPGMTDDTGTTGTTGQPGDMPGDSTAPDQPDQ